MNHPGPICSACTRDWDERLGYCDHCQADDEDTTRAEESPSSLHDQLVASLKLGPHRSNANTPGLWEDNFS